MAAPILPEIVRQHAEMAALLWTIYDRNLLFPEEYPELDEERVGWLVARLDAHLDGLRVAGEEGLKIAQSLYEAFPEPGELFVVRMMTAKTPLTIAELDVEQVRRYIAATLGPAVSSSASSNPG